MASAAIEVSSRIRLSDPKPSHCIACFAGAEDSIRFVDFDAAFDGGSVIESRDGVIIERTSMDDLHLCEACVRGAADALALKPELHRRQLREIRRLELQNEGLRDQVRALKTAVAAELAEVAA